MSDGWRLEVAARKKTSAALLDGAVRLERKIFPKNESWGDGLLEEAVKANTTMILAVRQRESVVGGYVLYRRLGAEGMIDKLAVAESERRQGLGRWLLRAAMDALRSKRCKKLHLLVDVDRRPARALYESEGFEVLATRKDYYREGRDALWMELVL